ncbi:hypothetical protein OAD66_08400 [Bacteroidia bacterium]|nr:hypothetical protein [Bacteroidia bacterium]MDB4107599.1 hypothetical protein [Bacteroidia bacterium]MDB9883136.1 hypothetical protein [Bacteroidia bacterium]
MKDLILKSTKKVAILAALFGVITLNSCKDDDELTPGGTTEVVEDGFYIQGPGTAYTGFDIKATLQTAKNEVKQEDRAELMEIYVAVKGGTDGFNIVQVAGTERTTWGPSAGFAVDAARGDEPTLVDIQRGGIEASASKFTVATDGLYHVVIDTEVAKAVITKVEWGIIGQATPTGWSGSTQLDAPAFDMSTMTYSLNGVKMSKGEWKFRYSGGWKVEVDSAYDLGDGAKGIKANCNYGGTIDALDAGGANMNTAESGIYNVAITWTAGSGHTATLVRTGDLPARDYSDVEVGIVGDGAEGSVWPANGDDKTELAITKPLKTDDVYTWAFNDIKLLAAGGFKLRTSGTWDDINLGYNGDITIGPGAGDIQDAGGNMQVKADGTYDIVFVVDAKAETMTISFTKK